MQDWFVAFMGAAAGCFIMDYVKPRWPVLWHLLGLLAVVVFIVAMLSVPT